MHKEDNKEACMGNSYLIFKTNPGDCQPNTGRSLAIRYYEATDDMSVITAGIWLKYKREDNKKADNKGFDIYMPKLEAQRNKGNVFILRIG